MEGTYKSCKQVSVPSTGQLAMDIMCGDWGGSRCTPKRWFDYMGSAEGNPFVPFQINYRNTTGDFDEFVPANPPIIPCSDALNVSFFK